MNTEQDNYGKNMLISTIVLFALLLSIFYKLQQKEPMPYNAFAPVTINQKIYILKSEATALVYHKNSANKSDYNLKLERLKSLLVSLGNSVSYIQKEEISTLEKDAMLIVADAVALKESTKTDIKSFLQNGGNLFFNFTTGFSDEYGTLKGSSFVEDITKLKLSSERPYLYFKDGLNLTQRLLSPLVNKDSGVLLSTSVYDNVPIFKTPKRLKPDIFMTNYSQTNPPRDKESDTNTLTLDEAGCAWHGYYGKGKWYYTNLPTYLFYESGEDAFKNIFESIINFLSQKAVVNKFPYIDREKVIFVSEDTEYKFKNFKKFSDLARKYKVPVTAFIVSSIAQKPEHKSMVRNIARNRYVEFASHSHTHKKIVDTNDSFSKQETQDTKLILDRMSPKAITGFRPPREELDATMKHYLAEGGFKYVLGSSQEYMYPRYDESETNLLLIPRHGTDDYSYLINLDWSREQIVQQMIKETKFVTNLDATYTLSIHTHLFAFKSNINIVEDYFRYLKSHREYHPLNGKDLAKRVKENKNIELIQSGDDESITLDIVNNNNNSVKNFHCKLFKNPKLKIRSIQSSQTSVRKDIKNPSDVILNLNYLAPNSTTTVTINFRNY